MGLGNLLRGRIHLAVTFWVWAVGGTIIIKIGWNWVLRIAVDNGDNIVLSAGLIYASTIFALIWSAFITISVLNSSGLFGRSIWGWSATFITALGIIIPAYITINLFFCVEKSWEDLERQVLLAHNTISKDMGEKLRITKIDSLIFDHSITFSMNIDATSLNRTSFHRGHETEVIRAYCPEFSELLVYPAESVRFLFFANDGGHALITQLPSNCGVKTYNLGPADINLPRAFYFQTRW